MAKLASGTTSASPWPVLAPAAAPAVVAVVVNYRAADLTARCVESLLASVGIHPRVVVVDNDSGDDSVERLETRFGGEPAVTIVARAVNDGYTGGNNAGVEIARQLGAPFVFIINQDAEVDPNCLRLLLEGADHDGRIAMVAPRIVLGERPDTLWFDGGRYSLFAGRPRHDGLGRPVSPHSTSAPHDVTFASGCALLVRLAAVAGPTFDDRLFMYAEDVDLSLRVRNAGHRIRHVPAALVRHHAGSAAGGREMRFYLNARNLIRVASRHARWYHWPSLAPLLAVDVVGRLVVTALRAGQVNAALAALRGARDAVRGGTPRVEPP